MASVCLAFSPRSHAQTTAAVTAIYSFDPYALPDGAINAHGSFPNSSLAPGGDGSLYGSTLGGGPTGYGTVFQITPGGTLTVLRDFGSGPLTRGSDGNLYGFQGDETGDLYSTIFRLTPVGTSSVLYRGKDFSGGGSATWP